MTTSSTSLQTTMTTFVSVPWNGFVAAFVYYTLLTIVAISGADIDVPAMAAAYALPMLAYSSVLAMRAVRGLASIRIDLFEHVPHALTH